MVILLDNGHGCNTSGKCSPDKTLREYKWAREIAARICSKLKVKGYDAELIVPEEEDISLAERCRRVNKRWLESGKDAILLSIHINAASSGNWSNARGWSGWVYTNASARSKKLAQTLYVEAERKGLKGNRSVPKEKYWTANFYILKRTNCPAVLTENLFMDNKDDCAYLLSDEGKKSIVDLHVQGIINYLKM